MQERTMNKTKGIILAVCRSREKSQPKEDEGEGILKEAHGLIGDAHAGTEKEISLLSQEVVDEYCQKHTLFAPPGSFAENLRIAGIPLLDLPHGTVLKIGEVELEITEKGKDPSLKHTYSYLDHSLLPTKGIFARVIKGGKIRKGDSIFAVSKECNKNHLSEE
jgi:MOSC domain-containing protein YiiM